MVPVDARLDVPAKLRLEAVLMSDVIDIIEQQARVSLIFLDACRNNPFNRTFASSSRSAVALAGLAQFSSTGSLIITSSKPKTVALDGTGRNSPFAKALLRHVGTPGLSIDDVTIRVRNDVLEETKGSQYVWGEGGLTERFEFVPDGSKPAPPPPPPATAEPEPGQEVAALERSLGDEASINALIADYLKPEADTIRDKVLAMYTETATLWGVPYDVKVIAEEKAKFFDYYKAWEIELTPGTTKIKKRGQKRAEVTFDMYFAYEPKDPAVAPPRGDARVTLGLIRTDDGWRIESETSEVLQ
jgi:uncharacterized caspase-like protein